MVSPYTFLAVPNLKCFLNNRRSNGSSSRAAGPSVFHQNRNSDLRHKAWRKTYKPGMISLRPRLGGTRFRSQLYLVRTDTLGGTRSGREYHRIAHLSSDRLGQDLAQFHRPCDLPQAKAAPQLLD